MGSPHIYTIHGIVLKRRNVGEADRIITIFTRQYGKIRVIAKGIRRIKSRRASHLEIFRQIIASIHRGKVLDYITEVQSSALLDTGTSQMRKVSFAYYLCELVDQLLPERQEHADVFRLMQATFAQLDASTDVSLWERDICTFALELLWILGYLPRTTFLTQDAIQPYIENIIERKLRTPAILTKLQ